MIYMKGCNLLNVLHLTAYRQYNLVRQQKKTVENTQLSNHSDRDGSFSGLVLKGAYHTALYLNNKIYSMNLKFTEWLKKCDDLSDVKFFDMIEQIDRVVWNFLTILSLNESRLSTFQKSFDFDWETHIYLGYFTITVEDSVLLLMLITCILILMQNPSCHLLQSQLTELIDSHIDQVS